MAQMDPVWIWVGILVFGIAMTTGYLNVGSEEEVGLTKSGSLQRLRWSDVRSGIDANVDGKPCGGAGEVCRRSATLSTYSPIGPIDSRSARNCSSNRDLHCWSGSCGPLFFVMVRGGRLCTLPSKASPAE